MVKQRLTLFRRQVGLSFKPLFKGYPFRLGRLPVTIAHNVVNFRNFVRCSLRKSIKINCCIFIILISHNRIL